MNLHLSSQLAPLGSVSPRATIDSPVRLSGSGHNSQFTIHNSKLTISGSKSETNRLLLLQALYPQITLTNSSDSDDSKAMQMALASTHAVIDIHHAGTAMRFLTAYFSMQVGRTVTLKGSTRMHQRPIRILVDALRQLGAEIDYLENDGFPPLKISGRELSGKVKIDANVSSQFISALLLIGAKLPGGIEIDLVGEITSQPYIKMTLGLLNAIGIDSSYERNQIKIFPTAQIPDSKFTIESDWSSASYFYSIVALSEVGTSLTLSNFKQSSLQGDSAVVAIYKKFGVNTIYSENSITLTKQTLHPKPCTLNLINTPDLAQTIAVTCFALGIECHLTGLHTLKIKETDRLTALKTELEKLGANVKISSDCITIEPCATIAANIEIETYNDHRMAMAFAPLALIVPIIIKDADVVSKSYPGFWDDLKSIGFHVV